MLHLPLRAALATFVFTGFTFMAGARGLPPPPNHPHGQVLWNILNGKCVPNFKKSGNPEPCAVVHLTGQKSDAGDRGFVVFKDRGGVAQYLVMPTEKITGIEDPAILGPDQVNYFAGAWTTGGKTFRQKLGRKIARDYVSVAVNSEYSRSQDQLHLHVDCLSAKAHAELAKIAPQLNGSWSKKSYTISGYAFYVMHVKGGNAAKIHPFQLLAAGIPGAVQHMALWTMAMVGAPDGGFYLLAGKADPYKKGWAKGGWAEIVQDHSCRVP